MNWEDATKELSKPLGKAHVKDRVQGGRKVSFVEGWHAIAEANRIFGFDGWSRETVSITCVSERERAIGREQKPGWGVTYTAKVRVVVDGVAREGCGAGHGIDQDLGQAHESAIKEAETDAMKRALMTFGNPFGLALYDKTQEHVADNPDAPPPVDEKAAMASIKEDLKSVQTVADLDVFWASPETQQRVAKLPGKSGAIMAMKDTREIALMLGEAKTLNDLESVWKEKTGTLEKLNQHMPKWYADLIVRYNDRKAQIADNHQIEHAKGQAA